MRAAVSSGIVGDRKQSHRPSEICPGYLYGSHHIHPEFLGHKVRVLVVECGGHRKRHHGWAAVLASGIAGARVSQGIQVTCSMRTSSL